MSNEASFSISVQDGRVEVSGSEDFVREQINNFKDVIKETVKALALSAPAVPHPPTPQHNDSAKSNSTSGGNQYPNVLALEEDGVKILKTIPGNNKATKTKNATLLFLLGMKQMGNDSVSSKHIHEVCKVHACFDSSNFATTLKSHNDLFLISGKGSFKNVKLSHPGEMKANELARELNGE